MTYQVFGGILASKHDDGQKEIADHRWLSEDYTSAKVSNILTVERINKDIGRVYNAYYYVQDSNGLYKALYGIKGHPNRSVVEYIFIWDLIDEEDIGRISAGDFEDIDDVLHSLHHLGYLAWYKNVKDLGHAVWSQMYLGRDTEIAYWSSQDMSGQMIEDWAGLDSDDSIPEDERVKVTCGYCGNDIMNSEFYNGHEEPKTPPQRVVVFTMKGMTEEAQTKAMESLDVIWNDYEVSYL